MGRNPLIPRPNWIDAGPSPIVKKSWRTCQGRCAIRAVLGITKTKSPDEPSDEPRQDNERARRVRRSARSNERRRDRVCGRPQAEHGLGADCEGEPITVRLDLDGDEALEQAVEERGHLVEARRYGHFDAASGVVADDERAVVDTPSAPARSVAPVPSYSQSSAAVSWAETR
jgi:hypothetical protein